MLQVCYQLLMGGWSRQHTRPADVLILNWVLGKPTAFDLSVTPTLNTQVYQEASVTTGSAALAAQIRKHGLNDERCRELGWVCIPLVVETYGCWGMRPFKLFLGLPLACPRGRPVPSHSCAMKCMEGLAWPL